MRNGRVAKYPAPSINGMRVTQLLCMTRVTHAEGPLSASGLGLSSNPAVSKLMLQQELKADTTEPMAITS